LELADSLSTPQTKESLVADVRNDQSTLSSNGWSALIDAINALHGVDAAAPAYRDFVAVHVRAMNPLDFEGMSWGVHTMGRMMIGRNFLAWHRQYLRQLERRLQQVDAAVTIPYWDWMKDREIPAPLNEPALLQSWSVTRQWDASQLPVEADLQAVNAQTIFTPFQRRLEQVHGFVHEAVGGTMAGSSSPADPLFFLHHANIDRLWSLWQSAHAEADPPNTSETLEPAPLFGVTVASVLGLSSLGYSYA
jgi:tyrosinase